MPHNLFTYSPDAFGCNRFYTESVSYKLINPFLEIIMFLLLCMQTTLAIDRILSKNMFLIFTPNALV
ncbi:uncharacterized protein DC041_0004379 [Schistosoma bovis]|uniref:Uncharacterized protein n=1 Tax=Schistosoma bovis TaxID=6184 RepID=A0A430PXM8_SCHBO|nr:uncharacterized protein DC041_0004379 [Schistosoma bovis]